MLEKFSRSAIQALNAAREEALRLEFDRVGAEHLLLGLLHEQRGLALRAFTAHRVTLKQVRLAVEQRFGRGYSLIRQEDLMFSAEALAILAVAAREQAESVESGSVFLALCAHPDAKLLVLFEALGLDAAELGRHAAGLPDLDEAASAGSDAGHRPRRFDVRRLTPEADAALGFALAAARHHGHTLVGTEQLFAGLMYEPEGLAGQALSRAGISRVAYEAAASRLIGPGSGMVPGRLGFSRRTEEALERAWAMARAAGFDRVGTGHVLLGLLDLDVAGALTITDQLDLDLALIRSEVEEAFRQDPDTPEPSCAMDYAAVGDDLVPVDPRST